MILLLALSALLQPEPTQDVASSAEVDSWEDFEAYAAERHGDLGARAAAFLRAHRPETDAALDVELLKANLRLAFEARERFPWAGEVDDELFLNDVLPYAVLDESRENWRPAMLEIAAPLVAGCETFEEAAQALNRQLFDVIEVHYNKGRKRPNASPSESMEQGRATCTGLTILLVDACRAVGVPARAAGVFQWHRGGNHTWAEIWDGERWRFTGADEYDAQGLDRAWFTADAAKAVAGDPKRAVWASSWKRGGTHFPLAWNRRSRSVAAVEVTERYRAADAEAALQALGQEGESLGEEAAQRLAVERWDALSKSLAEELEAEDEAKAFELGGHVLRVKERRFGDADAGERSLWISMHGGGGAPPAVNDRQWENQIRLYEPTEGIYVAPRAPTDTWNLWHQGHIDPLFERLIESYVTRHGVDPSRVYLLGYSAGGDGVYQLAPRMADRFAAAAMMAGHPNDAKPLGLRNLPFLIYMGGEDAAYDRNAVAASWKETLEGLRDADPDGYDHEVTIYPGKGHWMDGEDKAALPWMASKARDPWPTRVVWRQDDVTHDRFYWLGVPEGTAKAGTNLIATVEGQTIRLESKDVDRVVLWLRDTLIDLDGPLKVLFNGHPAFEGEVPRTREAIEASLAGRADPKMIATARVVIERPPK